MIEPVVERIWPDGVESVEVLGGGITNHNFKVVVGSETFVVRIAGADTEKLGIDRRVEHEATRAAAALRLGPEVVTFVEPEGYLVTRFVDGKTGAPSAREAGELLRRLHEGPSIPGRFDSFGVVESYAATAGAAPPEYEHAKRTADLIQARRGPYTPAPCHNDLLAANFIRGEQLWLVDWEYAGMGDPAFDLANFAVNNDLDEDGDCELLDAHGGDVEVHILMRFMSDFREAMWGVVQDAISQLDFDFAGYAAEHFERLQRTAVEPRFRSALGG